MKGVVLQYNGKSWKNMWQGRGWFEFMDIWASGPDDIYIVNDRLGGIPYVHYDGTQWTEIRDTAFPDTDNLRGIWGSSPNDIYAINRGNVYHYNGKNWSLVYQPDGHRFLNKIWGKSSSDIYVAGYDIYYYDGSGWSVMNRDVESGSDFYGLHGNDSQGLYAAGSLGIIDRFDGDLWHEMSSGPRGSVKNLWGTSHDNLYAVGGGDYIMTFDGTSWNLESNITGVSLNSIWGFSPQDIYACGGEIYAYEWVGGVIHYDGVSWSQMNISPRLSYLYSVWGTSDTNLFAGGDGGIYKYDGTAWTNVVRQLYFGIWGNAYNNIYAAGEAYGVGGLITHFDGSTWRMTTFERYNRFYGTWGFDNGEVFAVATNGIIKHYWNNEWHNMDSGTEITLHGIWGSSPDNVFASGDEGTVLHFDGVTWSGMKTTTRHALNKVWGVSDDFVLAAGYGGTILRYIPKP